MASPSAGRAVTGGIWHTPLTHQRRSWKIPVVADATVSIPTRLLVLGMAHHDGTIVAEEVFPVAEACGQGPEQVRSCFRRLVAEGLFTRDGEGRQARFEATGAGL